MRKGRWKLAQCDATIERHKKAQYPAGQLLRSGPRPRSVPTRRRVRAFRLAVIGKIRVCCPSRPLTGSAPRTAPRPQRSVGLRRFGPVQLGPIHACRAGYGRQLWRPRSLEFRCIHGRLLWVGSKLAGKPARPVRASLLSVHQSNCDLVHGGLNSFYYLRACNFDWEHARSQKT
jgi:hypothetical protein